MNNILERAGLKPELSGAYGVAANVERGVLTIMISHVAQRFLPVGMFGRAIATLQVSLAPKGEERGEVVIMNDNETGLWIKSKDLSSAEEGDSSENDRAVLMSPAWPLPVREELLHQINKSLAVGRAAKGKRNGFKVWWLVVLALLVMVWKAGGSAEKHQVAGAQVSNMRTSGSTVEATAVGSDEVSSSNLLAQRRAAAEGTMSLKDAITKANKVQLVKAGPKRPTLIVWSDVLCTHCRDFESEVVEKLPKDIGVTIIPVAFKDSRVLASYVLCGTGDGDKAERWKGLMSPTPSGALQKQCAAGPDQVDENSTLFARAGLNATPTIVSADGARTFGGDPRNISEVVAWAGQQ
jgi:protein-disulfide isomerase